MAEGDTLVNGAIGAVATVVLSSFVPFAPVFGGGVAGYLEGGDRSAGLRVGALAGGIALVPAILVGLLVVTLFFGVVAGGAATGAPGGVRTFGAFGFVAVVLIGVLGIAYFVGLSALGGWLGNYVKYDTDIDI
jgi:hypothetical protein